jgi:hypothetical protein
MAKLKGLGAPKSEPPAFPSEANVQKPKQERKKRKRKEEQQEPGSEFNKAQKIDSPTKQTEMFDRVFGAGSPARVGRTDLYRNSDSSGTPIKKKHMKPAKSPEVVTANPTKGGDLNTGSPTPNGVEPSAVANTGVPRDALDKALGSMLLLQSQFTDVSSKYQAMAHSFEQLREQHLKQSAHLADLTKALFALGKNGGRT